MDPRLVGGALRSRRRPRRRRRSRGRRGGARARPRSSRPGRRGRRDRARARCGGGAASTRTPPTGSRTSSSDHPNAVDARALYVACAARLRAVRQGDRAGARGARPQAGRRVGARGARALSPRARRERHRGAPREAGARREPAERRRPARDRAHRSSRRATTRVAFQAFSKATQEDPRDTTARLNMGTVLLRAGAYAKAEEQFRAILQVSPDDTTRRSASRRRCAAKRIRKTPREARRGAPAPRQGARRAIRTTCGALQRGCPLRGFPEEAGGREDVLQALPGRRAERSSGARGGRAYLQSVSAAAAAPAKPAARRAGRKPSTRKKGGT